MTVAPGDIVRLTCKMTLGSDDVQNVFHVRNTGAGSVADSTFLASAITQLDNAYDNIDGLLSDDLDFLSIEAYNVTQLTPIGEDAWDTMVSGGESTTDNYSKQVAALVKFGTSVAKSQGRKFIGGLTELNVLSGGEISSGLTTALGGFAAAILAGFTSDGQSFVFGNWNPTYVRFAEWITSYIGSHTATQRRRNVGVGS